jgi:hypothetical protein
LKPYQRVESKIPTINKSKKLKYSKSNQDLEIKTDHSTVYQHKNMDGYVNFEKKIQNRCKQFSYDDVQNDEDEQSPCEETLNYKPATLDSRTEIINIESAPNSGYYEMTHSNTFDDSKKSKFDNNKWVYENDESLYDHDYRQSIEHKVNYGPDYSSPFLSSPTEIIQPVDYNRELNIAQSERFDSHHNLGETFEKSHDSSKAVNRSAIDIKRQEVIKRKELLEKQRQERLERKIKEKDDKFKYVPISL